MPVSNPDGHSSSGDFGTGATTNMVTVVSDSAKHTAASAGPPTQQDDPMSDDEQVVMRL